MTRYYSFGRTVIEVEGNPSYKIITDMMRQKVGRNMWWEDIKECDVDDYINYLKDKIKEHEYSIAYLNGVIKTQASLIPNNGDDSLPF